jgi:hypothetical protein
MDRDSKVDSPPSGRFAGICGLLMVALSLAIGLVPPPPALGAPVADVHGYFMKHREAVLWLNYLGLVALVPNLAFFAHLAEGVRRHERDGGWHWLVFLSAAQFLMAAAFTVLALLQGAAFFADRLSAGEVALVADLAVMAFGFFFVTVTGFGVAFGWASLRTGAWPVWLAYGSFGVAAAALIASLGTVLTGSVLLAGGPATLGAFLLLMAWILAFSLYLLRR